MEKYFVNYSQALALKELGFDEPCLGFYDDQYNKDNSFYINDSFNKNKRLIYTPAPLKSQVFEFFRGYKLTVVIEDYLDDYEVKIVEWTLSDDKITHEFPNRFDSWGDAESAAIDKLIEIVKGQQD